MDDGELSEFEASVRDVLRSAFFGIAGKPFPYIPLSEQFYSAMQEAHESLDDEACWDYQEVEGWMR